MSSASDVSEAANAVADRGYVILENVIEPDFIAALREDLGRLERDLGRKPARNAFEGANTIRIYNLLVHGELYERIPVHERVLPVVERVLDAGCLVSSLSSIAIRPGEVPQPLHADDQLIPVPRPHAPLVCNTMWAITDFTKENGATRIVPSSHLRPSVPAMGADNDEWIPAEMPAGSVMIYDGALWHGGGHNRSKETRVGIAMNYCAGYLRQQENQQLGIPRAIQKRFSPRLRELVGYGVYRGLIGHIDKRPATQLLDDFDEYDAATWRSADKKKLDY